MAKRKSADARKLEIIAATLELAFEQGPEGITTERIAQKVGVTQPAVFRHFPRKDDIWTAVAGWISERMVRRWKAVLDSNAEPIDRLHAVLRTQFGLIEETPAIPAILFSHELHGRNSVLRTAVTGLMANFHAMLSGVLTAGVRSGVFRADLDIRDAAFVLIAFVQGMALRWSLTGRQFSLVDEGDRLCAIVIQGFVACKPDGSTESS
jgi:AcrR family transcriptional regulator